jgi:lactate/malate dehydrogenase, NAD binding domain
MTGKAKIAIMGAGHMGMTLAYACLIRGAGKTIALYGRDAGKVRAEVIDLQRGLQFVPMATVEGSDDVEVCRGADVLVVTVGGLPGEGQSRLDLAADGARQLAVALPDRPALRRGRTERARLRRRRARRLVDPAVDQRDRGRGAGYDILVGKGYTNYAGALAAARIIEAVLYDEHQMPPVSSLLTGYAGISDVCLSVPSVVSRDGVLRCCRCRCPRRSATACTVRPARSAPCSEVAEAAGQPLRLLVTASRGGQLTRQAAQATEAGRCDRSAIWSPPILVGRVLAGRCRPRVLQPVPSPARKKAVAWSMAARVARVWLSALSSMKSWMMPS